MWGIAALTAAGTLAGGGALLAGCSNASETTCVDYLAQSPADQKNTVIDLYNERGDEQPQAIMISAAAGAIAGYCDAWGDDATLNDAFDAFTEALQAGSDTGDATADGSDTDGPGTTASPADDGAQSDAPGTEHGS